MQAIILFPTSQYTIRGWPLHAGDPPLHTNFDVSAWEVQTVNFVPQGESLRLLVIPQPAVLELRLHAGDIECVTRYLAPTFPRVERAQCMGMA